MRRLLVAVGAAALLALPGSAGATITASSVDTSNGPFFDGIDSGPGLVITGHVTSDATSTDKVKLACDGYGELKGPGNAGYSVGSDGSVSINVGHAMDFYYCLARIVPLAATPPYDAAFAPTPIGITDRDNYAFPSPDDQDYYDWYQSVSGPAGYADGDSLGDCALNSTYTINSDYSYAQLFKCSGVFDSDPSDSSKSMILLDGVNTLTPYHAYLSFPPDQVQRITGLQHDVNTQTGEVLVSGSEALATCPASCTAPSPAGAHVDHSFHADHGGRLVTLADVWHNDRPDPVTLDVGYEFSIEGTHGQFQLPGDADFSTPTDGPLATPAPGPGFVRALHDSTQADGTDAGARGTIAWSTAPDSVTGKAAAYAVVLRYHRTIPAGGSLRISFGVATTTAQADADQLAADAIAATKPSIAITSPDDGATTGPGSVTVKGTSSDDGGPPAVNVNGVAATVGGDGTWSVDVPLPTDPTTLTATATDADGNTATATRTVHKAIPPVVPAITPTIKNIKVKQAKNGTITVTATVNEAGVLSAKLSGKLGKKTKTLAHSKKTTKAAGKVTLKLKPSKAARKRLRKRALKAKLALTFTANGKSAKASKTVKLKKLRR